MNPATGIGAARKTKLRRYWSDAESKRTGCRICDAPAQLHHLSGREYDPERDCFECRYYLPSDRESMDCTTCKSTGRILYVRPGSVIPLCPDHHTAHHSRGKLDLIPYTSYAEQASVVSDLGIERAYRILSGGGAAA